MAYLFNTHSFCKLLRISGLCLRPIKKTIHKNNEPASNRMTQARLSIRKIMPSWLQHYFLSADQIYTRLKIFYNVTSPEKL